MTVGESIAASGLRSTCPYCGVGCGVVARQDETDTLTLVGDADHPANAGRLCVKGSTLAQTQVHPDRLRTPMVDGVATTWDDALNRVADGFRHAIAQYGPDSVALYLSGQLLTEDYYVANKLMKGFIGSSNVDTNSRLCMASAVAAHKRAFGEDVVPCNYEDLEVCDLLVLVGSNAAWAHPVLYQRIEAAKSQRSMKIVVIDPRRTATCEFADLHLQISPGTDVALFNGLLSHLWSQGAVNRDFIAERTQGFSDCLQSAQQSLPATAAATGLPSEQLRQFFGWFESTERSVTLFSQGVNQSVQGTDKASAIINCHLATGRIGKPGRGPFSITGQPNAMGGREVGGMANQLAAHMDFEAIHIDRVQRFWQAPNMARRPGLKAVDLFDAVHDGRIKALWIMGTNPAVSLPDADRVRQSLTKCPLLVISDCVQHTDTARYATILLPARGWGEKDGTVTNSERCISRQRAFAAPSGEARADWHIVADVARRLGHGHAFNYRSVHQIFCEHAALTAFENAGERVLNLAPLAHLSAREYEDLEPSRWPVNARPYADHQFSTDNGRARFVATAARAAGQQPSNAYPFVVNSGRLRDQWHTMTRTGVSGRLFQHRTVPTIQLNVADAQTHTIQTDDLLELTSATGRFRGLAEPGEQVGAGQLFVPIHWTDQFAQSAIANRLLQSVTDPVSGQPESKHGTTRLQRLHVQQWLRVVARSALSHAQIDEISDQCAFWAMTPGPQHYNYDFAVAGDSQNLLRKLRNATQVDQIARFSDDTAGNSDDRLLARADNLPIWIAASADQKKSLPTSGALSQALSDNVEFWQRLCLARVAQMDTTPIICTCFEVTRAQIDRAIASGLDTPTALAQSLHCGSNCGSCVPELKALIRQSGQQAATNAELTAYSSA